MTTVVGRLDSPEAAQRAMSPRDDLLVREVEVAPGRFTASDGPFRQWERTVVLAGPAGTETIAYRIDVAHWWWLIDRLLRGPVRRGLTPGRVPFWCPSDRLDRRDTQILGLCATLALLSGFLGGLVGQTLVFITEDLGGTTSTQARALAVIRVGAVLTLIATALADRSGRRPMMRACLVGASVATLVTALAPNVATVTGSQVVARGLVAGAAFLVPIICAEELPARSRSYAIGVLSLPGGLGVGMVVWFLPLLDLHEAAWRLPYAMGLVTIVVAWRTCARLPETQRFVHDAVPEEIGHQHMRLRRLALLGSAMFLLNIFAAPTQQLQSDYLRTTRSMGAVAIFAFMILTNTWGIFGVIAGSRIGDRHSRRAAASLGLVGLAVGNTIMFQVSGLPMWLASLFGSVVGAATIPSLGALLPELFPTLRRGAANGLINGAAVLGSISGLLIVGDNALDGDYGPTIARLAVGPLLVAVMVWFLPETSGVELEELNPDD